MKKRTTTILSTLLIGGITATSTIQAQTPTPTNAASPKPPTEATTKNDKTHQEEKLTLKFIKWDKDQSPTLNVPNPEPNTIYWTMPAEETAPQVEKEGERTFLRLTTPKTIQKPQNAVVRSLRAWKIPEGKRTVTIETEQRLVTDPFARGSGVGYIQIVVQSKDREYTTASKTYTEQEQIDGTDWDTFKTTVLLPKTAETVAIRLQGSAKQTLDVASMTATFE